MFSNAHLLEGIFSKQQQCNIVISSSWRFHVDLEEIKLRLPDIIQPHIIGVTGNAYIGQYARYHEIVGYLYDRDKHFVEWKALDDSWTEFPEDGENVIRCNSNTGITDREVKLLNNWLKN